jgi:hypothetical protein
MIILPFSVEGLRESAFKRSFLPGNSVFQPFLTDTRPFVAVPALGNTFQNSFLEILHPSHMQHCETKSRFSSLASSELRGHF